MVTDTDRANRAAIRTVTQLAWLSMIAKAIFWAMLVAMLWRLDWTHGLKGVLLFLWEGHGVH